MNKAENTVSENYFLKKRELMKMYFAKKYEKMLDSLMVADTTAAVATLANGDSKKARTLPNLEVVHDVASSLFNASLEKLKPNNESPTLEKVTETSNEFWNDENFKQEMSSDSSASTYIEADREQEQLRKHFMDIFVEKLISRMVPERLPERERLFEPNYENERLTYQVVSATRLTQNLKELGGKMGGIFEIQDSIVRLLTWRNPSGTVTMLIILTMICFNPMYLLMLLLLYTMYAIMVPGYMKRHPLRRTLYPIKKVNGRSLLEELASGGKCKTPRTPYESRENQNNANSGVEIVANIRDFQNATTVLLSIFTSLEKFKDSTAGFKDERQSTIVFLGFFTVFCILTLMSPFVNWSAVVSFTFWSFMIAIHPKILPKAKQLLNTEPIHYSKSTIKESEKYDIILDESPEVRYVEIFEIYEQGITPKDWKFFKISNQVFDPADKFRKLQTFPPGVSGLNQVLPPNTWTFDDNSAWQIDYDVEEWSFERGLSLSVQDEFLVDDMFKRRRLTRKVVRYANPVDNSAL